jgi:hypothetical protein
MLSGKPGVRQLLSETRLQIDMFYSIEVNMTFNRWASFVNRCRKLYLVCAKGFKEDQIIVFGKLICTETYVTLNIQTVIFENHQNALGIRTKIIIYVDVCLYIAGIWNNWEYAYGSHYLSVQLNNLCSHPSIIRVIKSRRMK